MSTVYVSRSARPALIEYLRQQGHIPFFVCENGQSSPLPNPAAPAACFVDPFIATHPDIYFCKLGADSGAPVFTGDQASLSAHYPHDSQYNAACLGKLFIHNPDCTSPSLAKAASKSGLIFIRVRQGYTKCSIVTVTDRAAITSDAGIAKALAAAGARIVTPKTTAALDTGSNSDCELSPPSATARVSAAGLDLLLVHPGFVLLPGFPTGFLGGTSGRISRPGQETDEIVFHGDLTAHPDFESIVSFIESRRLSVKFFPGFPLTDIGSIIQAGPCPDPQSANPQIIAS